MSYTNLAATDRVSDSRATLNGTTTRKVILPGSTHGSTSRSGVGGTTYEAFTTGDIWYVTWLIDDRASRDVDATIEIIGCPLTAEASKETSWDIDVLSLDDTTGMLANAAATGTIQIVDNATPAVQYEIEKMTATLANATYFNTATVEALAFKITRVAATSDLVGDWGMLSFGIQYEIDR